MNVPLYTEILGHIKNHIYSHSLALPHWRMKEGDVLNGHSPRLNDKRWKDFFVTQRWGGYDTTVWFRTSVTLTKEHAGRRVVLVVDIPEGLLFVNGRPHHGVDHNHKEVLLSKRAKRGEEFHFAIEAYSGRKREGSYFTSASIAVLNPDARALHNAFLVLEELEVVLGPESNDAIRLRDIIGRTLTLFDSASPDSEEFEHAIPKAYNILRTALKEDFATDTPGVVHLIAQSHIDVVWLWTLKETRRKCARTFATALRLMDEFPEFNFSQSQALLYDFAKQHYPDIYKHIKQRAQERRWHPIGAMWVEPDCNIPNGESLVRQILYGKRFYKEEFGIDSTLLWLPDTFGYNWALPQILLKSGIKYFFTTKLTWNDTNRFPHNTFWWSGIDGSTVLAHIPSVGLEGQVTPSLLKKSWDSFQEKEQIRHTTQTFGYGDGGGGPSKQHIEATIVLSNAVGLPQSRVSTMEEFYRTVEQQSGGLPTWSDELYLELHRGTYTTHGWLKKENRRAETNLYTAELLSVLAMLHGGRTYRYPQHGIEQTWKLLLLNQFHDIVPGTAIKDAYQDVHRDFDRIRENCKTFQTLALREFVKPSSAGNGWSLTIFNSLSWHRSDYVTVEVQSAARGFSVVDGQGNSIQHQVVSRTKRGTVLLCYIEDAPPLSFTEVLVKPLSHPQQDELWSVSGKLVDSPYFRMRFDDQGQISSLFDKNLERELVKEGDTLNSFHTFRDASPRWEAWEIDPDYEKKEFRHFEFVDATVTERGPLRSVVRMRHQSASGSTIAQDITLYHRSSRIDFRTHVLWNEKQTMLKAAFPLNIAADRVHRETQFGTVSYPTNPTSSRDMAKYEIPVQQWSDLSEESFGVSLLNDCKYGFDAKDSTMRLTLIRSPHYPHPVEAWWLHDEEATDQGSHEFVYSLYPHPGDWRNGKSSLRARELNNPLLIMEGKLKRTPPSFLFLSHDNVLVDSLKKAESGHAVILRVHESHGIPTTVTMQFGTVPQTVTEGDLLEQHQRTLIMKDSHLTIDFRPFEIKTLMFTFSVETTDALRAKGG